MSAAICSECRNKFTVRLIYLEAGRMISPDLCPACRKSAFNLPDRLPLYLIRKPVNFHYFLEDAY